MKNKIMILLAIAAFALASCGDDDNGVKSHDAPYDHLGIGEPKGADCGDDCAYKNYNTSTGENAFPKPIYRVGANADGYSDADIQASANKIIDAYNNNTNGVIKMDIKDVDHFKAILTQSAQIVSGNGAYSLDGGTLKISVNDSADIADFLKEKALHDHLGIDEAKCTISAGCELKDYRTPEQKISFPEKEINRYGKEINYLPTEPGDARTADKVIRDTANIIIGVYNGIIKDNNNSKVGKYGYTTLMETVDKVCVVRAQNLYYTFSEDKMGEMIFGVDPRNEWVDWTKNVIVTIMGGVEPPPPADEGIANNIIVQLQPTNAVRVTNETRTEQPVVATRRKWVSVAETV